MSKDVIICCQSIEKEMRYFMKEAGCSAELMVMEPRYHAEPTALQLRLQELIDGFTDVDRVYICESGCGCGGATENLRATTCELVIPRTQNCVDLMLSKTCVADIERPMDGMFLTEGWVPYMEGGIIDYRYLVKTKGPEEAKAYANKLFGNFNTFYIIDTVPYDVKKVVDFILPMLLAVKGQLKILEGPCGMMKRIVRGDVNDTDFFIIPKGEKKMK